MDYNQSYQPPFQETTHGFFKISFQRPLDPENVDFNEYVYNVQIFYRMKCIFFKINRSYKTRIFHVLSESPKVVVFKNIFKDHTSHKMWFLRIFFDVLSEAHNSDFLRLSRSIKGPNVNFLDCLRL